MGPPTYAKGNISSASSIVQLDTDVFNGWSKEDVLVAAPRRVVGVSVLMDHCDYVERLSLCHQAHPPERKGQQPQRLQHRKEVLNTHGSRVLPTFSD